MSSRRPVTSTLLILACTFTISLAVEWDYQGPNGPHAWPGMCTIGQSQSPINFDKTEKAVMPLFKWFHYGPNDGNHCILSNNGKSVKMSMNSPIMGGLPEVSGGGLPSTYAFAQVHFHWGTNDDEGSEHLINETGFPLEAHLVHFNTKYGPTLKEAIANGIEKSDTLAVLGFLFEISDEDNENLTNIIEALSMIQMKDSSVPIKCFPLTNLFADRTDHFYRYNGSLTTPGCNEFVVWTVFQDKVPISRKQMQFFRSLKTGDVAAPRPLLTNFRPTQPLHGRVVLDAVVSGTQTSQPAAWTSCLLIVILLVVKH